MNASKIHELWILHKIIELNIQLAIVAKRLEIEQANPQQRFFSLFLPKIGHKFEARGKQNYSDRAFWQIRIIRNFRFKDLFHYVDAFLKKSINSSIFQHLSFLEK